MYLDFRIAWSGVSSECPTIAFSAGNWTVDHYFPLYWSESTKAAFICRLVDGVLASRNTTLEWGRLY